MEGTNWRFYYYHTIVEECSIISCGCYFRHTKRKIYVPKIRSVCINRNYHSIVPLNVCITLTPFGFWILSICRSFEHVPWSASLRSGLIDPYTSVSRSLLEPVRRMPQTLNSSECRIVAQASRLGSRVPRTLPGCVCKSRKGIFLSCQCSN